MSKLIAPRLCAWCQEPFTPAKYRIDVQQCCGLSCARRLSGFKRRGQQQPQLMTAVQQRADARFAALVADRFGMLSERERAIFRAAYDRGYDKGYNTASRPFAMARRKRGAA